MRWGKRAFVLCSMVSLSSAAGSADVVSEHEQLLRALLKKVGADDAELRRVERTPRRQARVMYDLARDDVERAKKMYCDAGDAVIDKFDPQAEREANLRVMEKELLEQLPRAREIGCLNHVENDQVYSVDVKVGEIPGEHHAAFVAEAERAVAEGKVERFLQPPRHPDAFHFEFKR